MKRRIGTAIVVMGFSGLVAEIILLRELLIVFAGNELSIGIILANWLILEAGGCYAAGRLAERSGNRVEPFAALTILFSLSLPAAVYVTRILKGVLGISIGEGIGFLPMAYSSFLVLLPASMLHGALFTLGCQLYSPYRGQNASPVGRVYVYETAGTIVGGIACTYLFVPHLNSFQASSALALLNCVVCLGLLGRFRRTGPARRALLMIVGVLAVLAGYVLAAGQAVRLHQASISAQWRNQNVVHYQNSSYGNICVVENQGQYIFFLDGIPDILTPVPDIHFVEEFVHLPLLAHRNPTRLLIVSGGAGGAIREALEHSSVKTIDYAELDPLLLDLFRRYPTPLTESELNDRRVQVQLMDGHLFLRTTRNTYDVLLIGIREPSDLQANRFFTVEFFSRVRERLNAGGILVLGLPGSLTLVTDELKNLNSCIFHTLLSVFTHVRMIPGDGTNLFLASDSREVATIDRASIVERLDRRNIRTETLLPWYIENKLHPGWREWVDRFLDGGSRKINSDLKPAGMFYSISHWNALHAPFLRGLFRQIEQLDVRTIGLALAVLILLYFGVRPKNEWSYRTAIAASIVTTGFAGMIFDLMVIVLFQVLYGYVFSWIGLLVASFMAGTACGALVITAVLTRITDHRRLFRQIDLAIIGCSFGYPLIFPVLHAAPGGAAAFGLVKALFLVISFISGLLIGSQFPLANELYLRESGSVSRTAGVLYASDLLGGWLGGMVGAVVLLPVLGLTGTCITVGLLKAASVTILATQRWPQTEAGGHGRDYAE